MYSNDSSLNLLRTISEHLFIEGGQQPSKFDYYFILASQIYGIKDYKPYTIYGSLSNSQLFDFIPESVFTKIEELKGKKIPNKTQIPTIQELNDYWGSEEKNKGDPNEDGTEPLTYILREYGAIGIPESRLKKY